MRLFLLLLLYFVSFISELTAQNPSFYRISEKQFDGIDIYTHIQDREGNMWFGADNGLFKYDGFEFKEYVCKESKSNSFFALRKDNNGQLFCTNLRGQIFTIVNDTFKVFYTLPDFLVSSNIDIAFSKSNDLLINTIKVHVLKNDTLYRADSLSQTSKFIHTKDGNCYYKTKHNNLMKYDNDEFINTYENKNLLDSTQHLNYYGNVNDDDRIHYLDETGQIYFFLNEGKWQSASFSNKNYTTKKIALHKISDSILLVSHLIGGGAYYVNIFTGDQQVIASRNYFISGISKDKEDNIWLITLGNGILKIPNLGIITYGEAPKLKSKDIIDIENGGNNTLLILTKNDIYKLQKGSLSFYQKNINNANKLFYNSRDESIIGEKTIYKGNSFKQHDRKTLINIKGIAITPRYIALGLSRGLVIANPITYEVIPKFEDKVKNNRIWNVAYDSKNNDIWAETAVSTIICDGDFIEAKKVTISNGSTLAANCFAFDGEQMWCGTKNGLYVYQDRKLVKEYSTKNGLVSNQINALFYYKNEIYVANSKGFQVLNLETKKWQTMGFADGLTEQTINKIVVNVQGVFVHAGRSLLKIDLTQNQYSAQAAPLLNALVLVNGIETSKTEFNAEEKDISFILNTSSIRHKSSVQFEYKLVGIDPDWQVTDGRNNNISFKNLSAGKYHFTYRTKTNLGVTSPVKNYYFSVLKPWYMRWWFLLLLGIIAILIVAILYSRRIRRIRKQAYLERQVLSSEIRAIKAQLNPHFIFNALNSVQDLIVSKDIRSSNIYLGKFAELMRGTLDSAEKETISIAKEKHLLNLYLELESLRFEEDFKYTIKSDIDEQEEENLEFPAMLLQPYVENAIKHGLLHKEGIKKLEVGFEKLNENQLFCYVNDNGIGRERSASFKAQNEITHQSFANKANEKRIGLINNYYKKKATLEITDIIENDEVAGTLVSITLEV